MGLNHYKSMTKQDKININQMAMEEGAEKENEMEQSPQMLILIRSQGDF